MNDQRAEHTHQHENRDRHEHDAHHNYHAQCGSSASPVVIHRSPAFSCPLPELKRGTTVLLAPQKNLPGQVVIIPRNVEYGPLAPLAVGTRLLTGTPSSLMPILVITGRHTLSTPHPLAIGALETSTTPESQHSIHAVEVTSALVLADHPGGPCSLTPQREGLSLAWVTLSDKGAAGQRVDESGPLIHEILTARLPIGYSQGFLIPDDPNRLRSLAGDLALHQGYDLIVTTGGTGIGPRDSTPEALIPLLHHRLYGFEQTMMAASLAKTSNAAISRAVAGTMGLSLIITLPGSKKAVRENLEAVIPAIAHAMAKLQGDPADCEVALKL